MYEGEDCQSLPRVLFGMSPWSLQWDGSRADTEVRQMQVDRSVFTPPPSLALVSFSPSPSPALALALEPLVVLLQAPQEVQGQHLPE